MGKSRRMKDNGDRVVTRSELRKLLQDWARAADVAMTAKVAQMKAEIREEVLNELLATAPKPTISIQKGYVVSGGHFVPADAGGSVPTDSEGPEA